MPARTRLPTTVRHGHADVALGASARTARECADLVRGILGRSLAFDIESLVEEGKDLGTALLDQITRSRFRFVTNDECLTNSFWNFYLNEA